MDKHPTPGRSPHDGSHPKEDPPARQDLEDLEREAHYELEQERLGRKAIDFPSSWLEDKLRQAQDEVAENLKIDRFANFIRLAEGEDRRRWADIRVGAQAKYRRLARAILGYRALTDSEDY